MIALTSWFITWLKRLHSWITCEKSGFGDQRRMRSTAGIFCTVEQDWVQITLKHIHSVHIVNCQAMTMRITMEEAIWTQLQRRRILKELMVIMFTLPMIIPRSVSVVKSQSNAWRQRWCNNDGRRSISKFKRTLIWLFAQNQENRTLFFYIKSTGVLNACPLRGRFIWDR